MACSSTRQSRAAAFAGPLLVLAAIGVWHVSDRLIFVGPFDRAQVGWAVVMPLLALAPGVAGLAEGREELEESSRLVANLTTLGLGLGATITVLATVTFASCRPVTNALEILPQALVTGLLAAATFALPYRISAYLSRQVRPWQAVVSAAALWVLLAALLIFVFSLFLFPALSCAKGV
jgi:hypothetical protein